MIETKILGDAVGVQRQDVIDKSETTVLPSLANGVIAGHFKRGRMDKPFKVAASSYKALLGYDPSNPSYLAVEDAFKNGVSELSVLRVGSTEKAIKPPVVKPPKPNLEAPLKFTTRRTLIEPTEKVIISTSKEAEWYLYEGDTLIADSTGQLSESVEIDKEMSDTKDFITILSATTIGGEYSYYTAKVDELTLYYGMSSSSFIGEAELEVEVTRFSEKIKQHKFHIVNADLFVPTTLPKYVTDLSFMFGHSNRFNQDISAWDMLHVESISAIFSDAKSFNQPIDLWDVSNIKDMSYAFQRAEAFDTDISNWNTKSVTTMEGMFWQNKTFSHNLSQWCVANVVNHDYFDLEAHPSSYLGWDAERLPVWGTCPRGENAPT